VDGEGAGGVGAVRASGDAKDVPYSCRVRPIGQLLETRSDCEAAQQASNHPGELLEHLQSDVVAHSLSTISGSDCCSWRLGSTGSVIDPCTEVCCICHRDLCAPTSTIPGFPRRCETAPPFARDSMAANGSPERRRRSMGMYRRESNMSECDTTCTYPRIFLY
jgi:hypothetical protein